MMKSYNIYPSKNLQKKIDFFFLPYHKDMSLERHMVFEVDELTELR